MTLLFIIKINNKIIKQNIILNNKIKMILLISIKKLIFYLQC